MSFKLFQEHILFLQRILAVSGFYRGTLNGKFSAAVEAAEQDFFQEYTRLKESKGGFDTRTELNIMPLIPAAQAKAREFLSTVAGEALTYRILSGTRTFAEQDTLFKKGQR